MRCLLALLFLLPLAGCGDSKSDTSVNPLDETKKNVQWSVDVKKDLKDSAKARANEADKIMDDRLKGGQK
jgi:hypothetical protein